MYFFQLNGFSPQAKVVHALNGPLSYQSFAYRVLSPVSNERVKSTANPKFLLPFTTPTEHLRSAQSPFEKLAPE